mgnify:CR=1 FL=1
MKSAIEQLHHFVCVSCKKWWTIGDAPASKKEWFCPWCGNAQTKKKKMKLTLSTQARKLKLGIYAHSKGSQCDVLGVAFHSETPEELVIYRAQYGEQKMWARPLTMFIEKMEIGGRSVARFKKLMKKQIF